MIRINLLGGEGTGAGVLPESGGGALAPTAWGALLVLSALLLVGAHYVYLLREQPRLERQLNAAQAENDRLQAVKKQVAALQDARAQLSERIQVIQQLGDDPQGPSPLLVTLGNSVNGGPDLWLTQLEATGAELQVNGLASNLDRIADFMTALNQSGDFSKVTLTDTTEKTGAGAHSPYNFRLALLLAPGKPPTAVAVRGGPHP